MTAALADDDGRPAAGQPRAAQQPAVPRRAAAPARRGHRAAGRRRGALHQRLGARLPARLPPDPRPARRPAGGPAGARHDRHRQRAGGRPTSSSSSGPAGAGAHGPRQPGPGQPAARRPHPRRRPTRGSAGWPPTSASCPAAASSTRSRSRRPRTPPPCCATPGTTCAPTPGRTDPADRLDLERALRANEVKALVATSRTRHGLRQAGPRLRRAPRCAGVARSPTTSRWAAPVAPPSAPTSCCCPRPRTARSGATSPPPRCRAAPTPTRC